MDYQKRFPIILDNEDNIEKFCIDARQLWEELECPQVQFNKWVERKFKPYGFVEKRRFYCIWTKMSNCKWWLYDLKRVHVIC